MDYRLPAQKSFPIQKFLKFFLKLQISQLRGEQRMMRHLLSKQEWVHCVLSKVLQETEFCRTRCEQKLLFNIQKINLLSEYPQTSLLEWLFVT